VVAITRIHGLSSGAATASGSHIADGAGTTIQMARKRSRREAVSVA